MADTAARLAIAARRNEIARFSIVVKGIDLSGAVLSMQVRIGRDVPGPPLFSLATVNSTAAEGLKFESLTVIDGFPTSVISARINASTMTDATKVPYMGEIGADSVLAYAMQWTLGGDARTRLYGDFIVVGSAFGSDNAPTNRPASYGNSVSASGGSSGASLQFGDQIVQVSIDGAGLLGGLVAAANAAASAAAGHATRAQNAANAASEDELESGRNAADAGAYLEAVRSAVSGLPIDAELSLQATSRALMASFPIESSGRQAILSEIGRDGLFVARSKAEDPSLAAKVAADPLQGMFVQSAVNPDKVWVRNARFGILPEWFGARANGVSWDGGAFSAAINLIGALSSNLQGATYRGGPKLFVPSGSYYLANTTLDIRSTFILEGEGGGMAGGHATELKWDAGAVGIRLQYYITDGDRQIVSPRSSASNNIVRGLSLKGGYAGGPSDQSHGIDMMVRATISDCHVDGFGGNGFNIVATAGGGNGFEGNANCFAIERCRAVRCRNGLLTKGADANAGFITGFDGSVNREFGIDESSFLGNTYSGGIHTSSNAGGSFRAGVGNGNNRSVVLGDYHEGDQAGTNFGSSVLHIPGTMGMPPVGGNVLLGNPDYGLLLKSYTGESQFGVDSASASKIYNFLRNGVREAFIRHTSGEGNYYSNNGSNERHSFLLGAETFLASIGLDGVDVRSGGLLMSGTKVVGSRKTGVPITVEGIHAALVSHGLIA